jgi:hypothetical protein
MTDTLIADLVTASFAASRETTDRLVENLQATIAAAEAHRQAVEHGIAGLLAGDHVPSAAAIHRAVFVPDSALVAYYRQEPTR